MISYFTNHQGQQPKRDWVPWNIQVVSKSPILKEQTNVKLQILNNVLLYFSTRSLHEAIVGALSTYIFNLGVSPSLTNYFGFYNCTPNLITMIEKSSLSLHELFGGAPLTVVLPQNRPEYIKKIENTAPLFSQIEVYDLYAWIVHILFALYQSKYQCGIVNLNVNLSNILLTHTGAPTGGYMNSDNNPIVRDISSIMPELETIDYFYDGKELSQHEFFCYTLPFEVNQQGGLNNPTHRVQIVIPNNGLLPKVSDYDLSYVDTALSTKFRRNPSMFFALLPEYYQSLLKPKEVEWLFSTNRQNQENVDVSFFLYNLIFQLAKNEINKNMIYNVNNELKQRSKDLSTDLDPLFNSLYGPQFRILKNDDGELIISIDSINSDEVFLKDRIIKGGNDIVAPLRAIFEYAVQRSSPFVLGRVSPTDPKPSYRIFFGNPNWSNQQQLTQILSDANLSNMIMINYDDSSSKFFREGKAIDALGEYSKQCNPNVPEVSQPGCKEIRESYMKNRSINYSQKEKLSFINVFTPNNSLWRLNNKDMSYDINPDRLNELRLMNVYKLYDKSFISFFTTRIEPGVLSWKRISRNSLEQFLYNDQQRMTNFKRPSNTLIGKYIEGINILVSYPDLNPQTRIYKGSNDLFSDVYNYTDGIGPNKRSIGITCGNNISAPVASQELGLTGTQFPPQFERYPIGYFYSEGSNFSGTVVPYPDQYRQMDMLAVIYVQDGKLKIANSKDFYAKHETTTYPMNYYPLGQGQPLVKTSSVIRLTSGGVVLNSSRRSATNCSYTLTDEQFQGYTSAIEVGPYLIRDRNVVFTRDMMNNSKFIINGSAYKASRVSQNTKMFFCDDGEEQGFPYPMRSSNALSNHNVLCFDEQDRPFFFSVQGKGFDTPGLDRCQLAALLTHFDVKHAVCIDIGLSSDIVFNNGDEIAGVMNNPNIYADASGILMGWSQ
jgi:hypothetical protein